MNPPRADDICIMTPTTKHYKNIYCTFHGDTLPFPVLLSFLFFTIGKTSIFATNSTLIQIGWTSAKRLIFHNFNQIDSKFRCEFQSICYHPLGMMNTLLISAWHDYIFAWGVLSWFIEAEWRIYGSVQHTNVVSDNGLPPVRHQVIIWTNTVILSTRP